MTKLRPRDTRPQEPPRLLVSRSEAVSKLSGQIAKGQELLTRKIQSDSDLETARTERSNWTAYNEELLRRIFSDSSIAEEYTRIGGSIGYINPTFRDQIDTHRSSVQTYLRHLEAIFNRLDLFPEPITVPDSAYDNPVADFGSTVFIVHGHDEAAKESVARFLEKMALTVIILHEQPNAGKTLIEKFIHNSKVGFAVVLMTPDDVGAARDQVDHLEPRARQNVIFELGYFVGFLGRERVCALHKPNVIPPSDWKGVAFLPMDDAGAWKLSLAKEIKQAGIDVDLNRPF